MNGDGRVDGRFYPEKGVGVTLRIFIVYLFWSFVIYFLGGIYVICAAIFGVGAFLFGGGMRFWAIGQSRVRWSWAVIAGLPFFSFFLWVFYWVLSSVFSAFFCSRFYYFFSGRLGGGRVVPTTTAGRRMALRMMLDG